MAELVGDPRLAAIEAILREAREKDLVALLKLVRSSEVMPIHGFEHHAAVAGILVAAYRNVGGPATDDMVATAIERGGRVPGGWCGFLGCCGAAVGVGAAFSVLLKATPIRGDARSLAQKAASEALADIAAMEAPRCCQRDSWLALRRGAELSRRLLERPLRAEAELVCEQVEKNAECIGARCPLHPEAGGR